MKMLSSIKNLFLVGFLCLLSLSDVFAAKDFRAEFAAELTRDPRVTDYLNPVRIVWTGEGEYENLDRLLARDYGQVVYTEEKEARLVSKEGTASILLDFGKQIHGGVTLFVKQTGSKKQTKIRLRFGESAEEAMSELLVKGVENGNTATNDHAIRDTVTEVPWLGKRYFGNTGFRFVRIDLLEPNSFLELSEVKASFIYRDIPYLGSFESSDPRLNKIWEVAAYTVHLNMQDYLWDGIKRDRLVWVGDLHPEIMVVNHVFGYNPVVPKSLDLSKIKFPVSTWMNGISTYSLWWIICHKDWYLYQGDYQYLKEQEEYLAGLVQFLAEKIDESGKEMMDGWRFLDWPTQDNPEAKHAGIQALLYKSLGDAAYLFEALGNEEMLSLCRELRERMAAYEVKVVGTNQDAALLSLAGLASPRDMSDRFLLKNGLDQFSTFYGYYMLEALAKSGDIHTGMSYISKFWGGMLDLGATSFWEDFDLGWMENAGRVDQLTPAGKVDVHGSYGKHCYIGFRHSLCHGWAGGPAAWLSSHVLGVQPIEPGAKVLKVEPYLGDLTSVKGTFPSPHGVVTVEHQRKGEEIFTTVNAPKAIKIIAADTAVVTYY